VGMQNVHPRRRDPVLQGVLKCSPCAAHIVRCAEKADTVALMARLCRRQNTAGFDDVFRWLR
jgi:hypothetical protein